MASGSPSNQRQMPATSTAFSGVNASLAPPACARASSSATASMSASAAGSAEAVTSGTASGGTANSYSPDRCSTARLVTRIFRLGAPASRSPTWGAAATTCSKLSSSNSTCRPWRWCLRLASVDWPAAVLTPRVWAIVGITNAGSCSGARSTNQRSTAEEAANSCAACSARRVLPMPPGPVSVTRQTSVRCSSAWIAATSCLRPIKRFGDAGRLLSWGAIGSGRVGTAADSTAACRCSDTSALATRRKAARSSGGRARQSASRSAIWREGRRSSASIFLTVATAQPTCFASLACVRSRALRRRRIQ